jgi:hypothetical protein
VLYITINLFFLPALVLDALRVVVLSISSFAFFTCLVHFLTLYVQRASQENRTDVLLLKREPDFAIRVAPTIGDVIEVSTDYALPPPPPYERLCHVLFRKAISPVMTKLPVKIAIVRPMCAHAMLLGHETHAPPTTRNGQISVIILTVGLSIFVIGTTQFALSPHPRQDNLPSYAVAPRVSLGRSLLLCPPSQRLTLCQPCDTVKTTWPRTMASKTSTLPRQGFPCRWSSPMPTTPTPTPTLRSTRSYIRYAIAPPRTGMVRDHISRSVREQVDTSGCVRPDSVANWYSDYISYLVSKGQNISDFYQPQENTSASPTSPAAAACSKFD